MTLSVKEIQAIEAKLPKAVLPDSTLNMHRLKEIDELNITPSEALEYALIRNNSWIITEALKEHGLDELFEPIPPEPEESLEYAINKLPANILTTLLNAHGYQPIPNRKQALRNTALLKPH